MKYEIIVNRYDDDMNLASVEKLDKDGEMYDGVAVIADGGSDGNILIESMSISSIAATMSADDTMAQAAILAEAMIRADNVRAERDSRKRLHDIFRLAEE